MIDLTEILTSGLENWPLVAFGWFVFANLMAYWLFKLDKTRAEQRVWRISEGTLLFWAFVGGWPAAKYAQRKFRHKTRKQPFGYVLNLIPAAWWVLVIVLWLYTTGNFEALQQ